MRPITDLQRKVNPFEVISDYIPSGDQPSAIAELAMTRGTGARGLRSILEETLLDAMYELPGRTDIARVVVNADCVKNKAMPELVTKTAARAPRQRRAAS